MIYCFVVNINILEGVVKISRLFYYNYDFLFMVLHFLEAFRFHNRILLIKKVGLSIISFVHTSQKDAISIPNTEFLGFQS